MKAQTRVAYTQFLDNIARLNGTTVAAVVAKFAVEPSIQQTMESKIQESSAFLQKINMQGVDEQQGEKLGLMINGPIASRTNTETKDRATTDPTGLDSSKYKCEQTNFDTHITYPKLDAWAGFKDFAKRINATILARIALDRMMIGFNGTSVAADSNKTTSPLLQDVNKGWLQKVRDGGAAHWVKQVGATANQVPVGAAASFKTLDALVYDAVNNLIDPWYREDNQLVAIMGRKLLADKYFPLVNTIQPPTEQIAAQDLIVSQRRIGNVQAVSVPFFPANSLLITRLDNLSLYWQKGAMRRSVIDNPKRDRIETYQSSNDAYVIEDIGCTALIDNITLV